MNLKKIFLSALICPILLTAGCAGKTPNPVQVYQPNDQHMTCQQIRESILDNHRQIAHLYPKAKNKTGKNVVLGVAGAFILVPWFFMDFSDAERVEIQALQRRDQHLHMLAERKKCSKMPPKVKFTKARR